MPSGLSKKMHCIVERQQDGMILRIWRSGPFLEVYAGSFLLGKVRGLTKTMLPDTATGVSVDCIKLPNAIIMLTDEEAVDLVDALTLDQTKSGR